MRIQIGLTIGAMVGLFLLALSSAQIWDWGQAPKPSQCSPTTSVLACPPAPIQTYQIPDSTQAEWRYCGNDNGPCTVHALVDGQWAIVELVKP